MTIRPLYQDEKSIVSEWWSYYYKGFLSSDVMSDHGYLAVDGERKIAALFFFPTVGCPVAFMGWPVANPDSTKDERTVAMDLLINKIEDRAKSSGYRYLTSYASRPTELKRLENHKFLVGDTGVAQLIKRL